MSITMRRILIGLSSILLLAVLAAAIYLPQASKASFPIVDGKLTLSGLEAPVDIYRDSAGIPHIFASSEHDLYFAQGFTHAQDRFWQMDFQRHASAGRLSEMMGGATLETDIFLRSMGWDRIARIELQNLDSRTLSVLEAYADGVNAYLEGRENIELSFEYLFLKILNNNYVPEAWEPVHTLTWAKAMAWDLRANMGTEIQRAVLLNTLSPDQIADLYPEYPQDRPVIVPDFNDQSTGSSPKDGPALGSYLDWSGPLSVASARFDALDELLGTGLGIGIGSNSWVVSGQLSESGLPLLANDPHLGVGLPSIWYQNSLHCLPNTPDCSLEVSGVSFVGAPGVVIGHNANIAWGFTNTGPDVMDLYIIKVNPENENQYEMNGEWVDMEITTENIEVAGKDNVLLPVRMTQFGPIISDSYGPLLEFEENAGIDLPQEYAIALRWTALEVTNVIGAIVDFNFASNWDEFRQATRGFSVPSQNLIYADVDGNIGYQMPGNIPIRANGDGRYPVQGWTDDFAWTGYIPFEELPYSLNPDSGYIVTANNAVVSDDYAYLIADTWAYGFRAERILEMLLDHNGLFSVSDFQQMQMDNQNIAALEIIPYLTQLEIPAGPLTEAMQILEEWDGQQGSNSAGAALYNAFWKQLLAATFHDDLPEDYWPSGSGRWSVVILNLLEQANSFWWDQKMTDDKVEMRDDILLAAFLEALNEIEDRFGKDSADWNWGAMHVLNFEHPVMSSIPLVGGLFNRGPFETSGGGSIVNATSWDADSDNYEVTALPSKRTVMDLSDWQNSLQIHSMGQSGHAYHPNYVDMTDDWREGANLPMHWEFESIQSAATSLLRLEPK